MVENEISQADDDYPAGVSDQLAAPSCQTTVLPCRCTQQTSMKLTVHRKKDTGLQELKTLFQIFIHLKLFKPVWLRYTGYISLFISDYDKTCIHVHYETRKNRNQTRLKKFKLKTNQALTNVSQQGVSHLGFFVWHRDQHFNSAGLFSATISLHFGIVLHFKSLNQNLSLLSLCQQMFLYIVQLNSLGTLNSFCL